MEPTEQRKQAAKALHANPLLSEILDELRLELLEAWENAGSTEHREKHWHEVKALENTRDRIRSTIAELLR